MKNLYKSTVYNNIIFMYVYIFDGSTMKNVMHQDFYKLGEALKLITWTERALNNLFWRPARSRYTIALISFLHIFVNFLIFLVAKVLPGWMQAQLLIVCILLGPPTNIFLISTLHPENNKLNKVFWMRTMLIEEG